MVSKRIEAMKIGELTRVKKEVELEKLEKEKKVGNNKET